MRAHNAKQFVSISINVISRLNRLEIYSFIYFHIVSISNDNEWEFFGKKKKNKTKWKGETNGDEKKKKSHAKFRETFASTNLKRLSSCINLDRFWNTIPFKVSAALYLLIRRAQTWQ